MANKKISELQSRTPALSDLMLVGDPSSGYSYKCTVTALATIIETDIADGYVTIGTTQTISGAKTFSNNLTLTSVANATTTQSKFLTLNASNVVNYRTGAEVLADIGGASSSSISGTTNYVAKFTSSSAIGNSQIFDNGTSVGINTATPNEKLEVSGVLRVSRTTSASAYLNLTIENGVAGFDARGSIDQVFYTGALERMRLTFGGNLGIGTSNPTTALDVNGVIKTNNNLELTSSTPTILWTTSNLRFYNNTNGIVATISDIGQLTLSSIPNATIDTDRFLVSDSGVIKYRTGAELLSDIGAASSSSISGTTNYIPKFTSSSAIGNSQIFDNGTNVGIGTASPSNKLDVNGVVRAFGTGNTGRFYAQDTNVGGAGVELNPQFGAGLPILQSIGSYPLLFGISGSERMRLDASGNLGIGTSSPTEKLTVNGRISSGGITSNEFLRVNRDGSNTLGSGAFLALYNTAFTSAIFQQLNASNGLDWWTTSAKLMTLDASGNLGLGVTPSAWGSNSALQIRLGGAIQSADITGVILSANVYNPNNSGSRYISNGAASQFEQYNGGHYWFTAPSGTAGNAISFTQAMTLTASGNLGIGTTSPNIKLVVAGPDDGTMQIRMQGTAAPTYYWEMGREAMSTGDFRINESNAGSVSNRFTIKPGGNVGIGTTSPTKQLSIYDASSARLNFTTSTTGQTSTDGTEVGVFATNNNAFIWNYENSDFYIGTNNTERMRITSGGNVGIGTTSPARTLTVYNTAAADAALIESSQVFSTLAFKSSTNASTVTVGIDGAGNAAFENKLTTGAMSFVTNGSERMRITSGGNVGIGNSNPAYKLSVNGGISANNDVTASTGALGVLLGTASTALGSSDLSFIISDNGAYGTYNDLIISPRNNGAGNQGNFRVYTSASERMRITSGGDVGIGVTSPGAKLEVNGAIKTAAPSGGNAASWKLGERVASSSLTLNTTQYIQLDINGTLYTLATVNLS